MKWDFLIDVPILEKLRVALFAPLSRFAPLYGIFFNFWKINFSAKLKNVTKIIKLITKIDLLGTVSSQNFDDSSIDMSFTSQIVPIYTCAHEKLTFLNILDRSTIYL